jgi:hypothetical protein
VNISKSKIRDENKTRYQLITVKLQLMDSKRIPLLKVGFVPVVMRTDLLMQECAYSARNVWGVEQLVDISYGQDEVFMQ